MVESNKSAWRWIIRLAVYFVFLVLIPIKVGETYIRLAVFLFFVSLTIICFVELIIALKRKKEKARRALLFLSTPESFPALIRMPIAPIYKNAEEETVYKQICEYLTKRNEVIRSRAHYNYLIEKKKALQILRRSDEENEIDNEINDTNSLINKKESSVANAFFTSSANAIIWRSSEIKRTYSPITSLFPSKKLPFWGHYFQGPFLKALDLGGQTLVFTPLYVLFIKNESSTPLITLYNELEVSSELRYERLIGSKTQYDEVHHIGYLHETKDGSCDMRYSIQNNPSIVYVYRGSVTIKCKGMTYVQQYCNKTQTRDAIQKINKYITLIKGEYKDVAEALISHDSKLMESGDIDTYMSLNAKEKQEKEEKERQEKLRFEKLKREYEASLRREREEEERRKQERKAAEEKAREEKARREREWVKRGILKDTMNATTNYSKSSSTRSAPADTNFDVVSGRLVRCNSNVRHFEMPSGSATVIGPAFKNKTMLESVKLPYGIIKIESEAFWGSPALKSIVIPNSVTEIGAKAFCGCSSLNEVALSNSLSSISELMFANCAALKKIRIPSSVKSISSKAFSGCTSLEEIIIDEGVTSIGEEAFLNCASLKKITFPKSISSLGSQMFLGCDSLYTVVFKGAISVIPAKMFMDQKNLTTVVLPPRVEEIDSYAFKNCTKLKQLVFKNESELNSTKTIYEMSKEVENTKNKRGQVLNSLTIIGKSAFENCGSFYGLEFGNNLSGIGDNAFSNCKSIELVELTSNLTSLGTGAFSGCSSLEIVTGIEFVDWTRRGAFSGTPWLSSQSQDGFVIIDDFLEAYVGAEEIVEIPNTIKDIGYYAFDGNDNITKVIIPEGVKSIGYRAFANCYFLESVVIPESVKRISENAFDNDESLVISCYRGSEASSFRIRNKIPGEYLVKPKISDKKPKDTPITTNIKASNNSVQLSDEELKMILELRKAKEEPKSTTAISSKKEAVLEQKKDDYQLVSYDGTQVKLKIKGANRKITNNIFSIQFEQDQPVDHEKKAAEYELFFIDSSGITISDVIIISADKSDGDLIHKGSFNLRSRDSFDRTKAFYLVVRVKGEEQKIVEKIQYEINISFASDFDF